MRIDYILVFPNKSLDDYEAGSKEYIELEKKEQARQIFEKELLDSGFAIQYDEIGENVFMKLHAPFPILCIEADKCQLEMPLEGVSMHTYTQSARMLCLCQSLPAPVLYTVKYGYVVDLHLRVSHQ